MKDLQNYDTSVAYLLDYLTTMFQIETFFTGESKEYNDGQLAGEHSEVNGGLNRIVTQNWRGD
jgi:hypothetical protein